MKAVARSIKLSEHRQVEGQWIREYNLALSVGSSSQAAVDTEGGRCSVGESALCPY